MRFIFAFTVAGLLSGAAYGCPDGCVPYEGLCACDQVAQQPPMVKASDEKPPKSGMPAYQAAGVHPDMPKSLMDQDAKWDEENRAADAEGKAAAGIK